MNRVSRTMFNAAKDALASQAAKAWANTLIARYGKVQDLKIDSARKTVEVSCLLKGEPSPITIRIENYTVETEGDKKFIRAANFSCSRPWLQNLLADFGHKQRVELPPLAAAVL
ncbi:MAG TPA: hypothetical protein VNW30_11430 [Opitutaceae bacterium]|nr:hypothetical protein [Opitutaceae bacterium]